MATIKSYSDLQQSKKLAEILPLVSADMWWSRCTIIDFGYNTLKISYAVEPCNISQFRNTKEDVPCWSLAALLGVLPNKIVSHETAFEGEDAEGINDIYYKHIESTEDGRYMCLYSGNGYKYRCVADNPVDACYEMILKLNELNLL